MMCENHTTVHGLLILTNLNLNEKLVFTCGEASRSMDDIWPFFPGTFSSEKHLGARKAPQHGLLRPVSSNMKSEVTPWIHRSQN